MYIQDKLVGTILPRLKRAFFQASHENLCNCEFVFKLKRTGMEKYKEVKICLSVLLGICRTACVDISLITVCLIVFNIFYLLQNSFGFNVAFWAYQVYHLYISVNILAIFGQ